MNCMCGRTSSDKEKILNNQLRSSKKGFFSMNKSTALCSSLKHNCKIDGQCRRKRLKSRKERSHVRDGWKKASKSKSHPCHCHRQTSQDIRDVHNCCHSKCNFHSGTDTPCPNVALATQEPSIITDNRLIGHQGLFNHEVKSIDIERLLSEQKKQEKSCLQIPEKTQSASHPSLTSNIPFSSTINIFGDDIDEVVQVEQKVDLLTHSEYHDDFFKKEKSQGSDLTPGQRPLQQPDLPSGNSRSIASPKHNSISEMEINSVMFEKGRELELTPIDDSENVTNVKKKVEGHIPKNQESPLPQTEAHLLSTPLLVSSQAVGSVDVQDRRREPDHTSQSVSALAARLCNCLKLRLLKRESLVSESREVLLKALQERHGPQLQENLLKVQQRFSCGIDATQEIQDPGPTMTDLFSRVKTDYKSAKDTRGRHFKQLSSPHQKNWKQTPEWSVGPVDTSVSFLDEIFQPTHSPQFPMDLGITASNSMFGPSADSWLGGKTLESHHWEDRCNVPKGKTGITFGSFINHTSAVTEGSRGFPYNDSSIQSFFPNQAQLPDGRSAGEIPFSQQNSFGRDRYSLDPSFSAQIHHPQELNHFEPLSQFSHFSNGPPLSSQHINMMHFPPSHNLDGDPAHPLSSFPSPDRWSFPPMKLY